MTCGWTLLRASYVEATYFDVLASDPRPHPPQSIRQQYANTATDVSSAEMHINCVRLLTLARRSELKLKSLPIHLSKSIYFACGIGVCFGSSSAIYRLNKVSCLFSTAAAAASAGACHITPGLMVVLRQIRLALKDYCGNCGLGVSTSEYNRPIKQLRNGWRTDVH